MGVTDSRQRNGSLTIDGIDYACQASSVLLVPPAPPKDTTEEVLCGDPLPAEDTDTWTMKLTAVQDFEDPDGFVVMTWTKSGTWVSFVWKPQGATGPSYSGTVRVWPVEVGGAVRKRLDSDAEWTIESMPVRAEAV